MGKQTVAKNKIFVLESKELNMSDFINLISSYNLLNYFLPGALLFVSAKYLFQIDISLGSDFYAFVILYFVGLFINRIGSLIIEPVLRNIGFLKFAEYEDFCKAENIDEHGKLQILSKVNNSYRSYTVVFLIISFVAVAKIFKDCKDCYPYIVLVVSLFSFLIFLFSYKKQTKYVASYVNNIVHQHGEKRNDKKR